mmetsp:Transcript_18898/g.30295  ORF Transcript_18898/g.30295 Transcript_18898/m.30295 type:complete len:150 (+) Transcript_18898:1-450(+)
MGVQDNVARRVVDRLRGEISEKYAKKHNLSAEQVANHWKNNVAKTNTKDEADLRSAAVSEVSGFESEEITRAEHHAKETIAKLLALNGERKPMHPMAIMSGQKEPRNQLASLQGFGEHRGNSDNVQDIASTAKDILKQLEFLMKNMDDR